MPISEGDRIGTSDGRAEIHFGKGNFIRLDAETKLDVLNLPKKDDDVARLRVWSGSVYLVVGTLKKEKGIELHTADSSFYVLDRGVYRVDVRENRDTEIEVFEGLIEVAGEDGSSLLKAGQRLEVSEGRFASKPSSFIAVANDSFDKFNESRNSATRRQFAKAYLPEELSDFEAELDEYGEWKYLPPTATSGCRAGSRTTGAPTTTAAGPGCPCRAGPGGPTSPGAGRPSTTDAGTGASTSAGTGSP